MAVRLYSSQFNKKKYDTVLYALYRSRVGRPRVELNVEDIEFLWSLKFNWVWIASILGISRATLYRRLDEFGISRITSYSNILQRFSLFVANDPDWMALTLFPNEDGRMINQ